MLSQAVMTRTRINIAEQFETQTQSRLLALGAKEPLPILRESRMLLRIGPNRQEKLPFLARVNNRMSPRELF